MIRRGNPASTEVRIEVRRSYLYLLLALVPFLLSVANLYFGRSEFGGYDLSALIDAGWRIMNAQVPTQSFICTLPPSLYLLCDIAFRLFGVRWLSLLIADDMVYLLLCFLGLRLCWLLQCSRPQSRQSYLPWIYVASQSILLASVNHPWHSTMASGVAAYAILATYTLLVPASISQSREVAAHLAAAFAILLICKPNTAWAALLLCVVCLSRDKRVRFTALFSFAAAALADILLLAAFHITLFDAFDGYLGLSGRIIPRLFLLGIYPERNRMGAVTLLLTYLFISFLALRMLQISWPDRFRIWTSPTYLLCVGSAFVTLIGLGTNWEMKIVDIPPFLMGAALLATTNGERYKQLVRPLFLSAGLLFVFSAILGIDRIRMIGVGAWAGPAYGPKTVIHDKFFGDFTTRRSFAELLSEVDLVTFRSRGKTIFFGPRLEFLYAREGLPSPDHLPIWWHPGTSYSIPAEPAVDKDWEHHGFEVLIFARNDRTRFPRELLDYMDANYTLDESLPSIDVLYRK